MSERLKKNVPYLHVLARGSPTQRQGVLKGANTDLVKCLCECALNILKGNVPLSAAHKRKLKTQKKSLRLLSNKKVSIVRKKKLINQKGGFISAIAAPVLGILGELIIGGIRKGIARRRQRRQKNLRKGRK